MLLSRYKERDAIAERMPESRGRSKLLRDGILDEILGKIDDRQLYKV